MDKVSNRLCRAVVFVLFVGSTLPTPVLEARANGEVEGWAHALYWKPTCGRTVWATELSFSQPPATAVAMYSGNLRSRASSLGYAWGVEAGATYWGPRNCLFAEGAGLYLNEQKGSTILGNLTPTLPFVRANFVENSSFYLSGEGRGDVSLCYGKADLKGGVALPVAGCWRLRAFVGVRYVYLHEMLTSRMAGTHAPATDPDPSFIEINQSRRLLFSGTGPTFGLSGHLYILGGLGIDVSCAVMTLVGTQKSTSRALFSTPIVLGSLEPGNQRFAVDRCVGMIPGIDGCFALSYACCWRCITLRAEAGYTLTHYGAAFNERMGSTTHFPSLVGQRNTRDVGFAGPHIGGSIAF